MSGWIDYWNAPHSVFVKSRHAVAHHRRVAEDVLAHLPVGPGTRLLDFGCGEALGCRLLAERGVQVMLHDRSAYYDQFIRTTHGGCANVRILSAADIEALRPGSIDVLHACSVLQYLSPADLDGLIALARRGLAPGGLLVLSDVVPRSTDALADVGQLVANAGGVAATFRNLFNLLRLALSSYTRYRRSLGLRQYDESDLVAALGRHFELRRLPVNFGFNKTRTTYVARRTPEP